jgi:hypothetical protein
MAPYYGTVEHVESRGDQTAVSPKGAQGVMQLMPGTMRDPGFGVTPPRDNSEAENRRAGREYLDAMHSRYKDPTTALMAYNWGPGSVDKWIKNGRNPNAVPKETRNYVKQITGQSISGQQSTGSSGMATPVLTMDEEQNAGVQAPTLVANPSAPAAIQARPVLTEEMVQGVLGPQSKAVEASPGMLELDSLNREVDSRIRERQAGVIGPEAEAFARANNLPLQSKEVMDFAAKRNVGTLKKGLSFLQGIVGLPFGILGNALGENIDYTSAFTPEKSFKTRAQAAISDLDAVGIKAKTEIAGMRQDVRKSIFDAVQPAVKEAYEFSGKRDASNIGSNLEEKAALDALRTNGYVNEFGEVDFGIPGAMQFYGEYKAMLSKAENSGKPRGGSGGGAERERWFEVLKNAAPDSREYATAYGVLSAPKVVTTPEGSFSYPGLDLSGMGYTAPGGMASPAPAGGPVPVGGPAPANDVPVGMPGGSTRVASPAPNEFESKMAGFTKSASRSNAIIADVFKKGLDLDSFGETARSVIGEGLNAVIPTSLGDQAQNAVQSDLRQKFSQAADEWVDNIIRARTGAGLNASEPAYYKKTFIPQPGDSAAVRKQKNEARVAFEKDTEVQARRALMPTPQYGNAPAAKGGAPTGRGPIVIDVNGKRIKQ